MGMAQPGYIRVDGRLRDSSILKSWQVKVTGHIVFTQMNFSTHPSTSSISAGGCGPAFSSLSYARPHCHPPSSALVTIRPRIRSVPVVGPALYWSLLSLFSWGLRGAGPVGHCVLSQATFTRVSPGQSWPPGEWGMSLALDLHKDTGGQGPLVAVMQCCSAACSSAPHCSHHNMHQENN